ncbi:UDP-4-amino-4,6-dideoxy-N-acetyl-beta-L-altrosamine N-acetyltransferase [Marinobacter sp. LV10R510-11A]|uniref:UDP-4-amino-4, 6-dideoxy-N-acetyl-beta-L-altrosamine N-acetyltransferase n=1 Tax=Marinobacter sp. LV10R510-11A TaxID=1415568 RepID=UPI000BC05A05|nr:UDP-4-amino-4,6-dideoxy-N-acetyl-beta-L-altrosamine N-acetyltransferase [Marinobacter sp. LV10R510-11A]SOB76688.1 UDP-4-amino-4,6-dideoxy-N-acetyl-beta-L-altrosamine N-acetyltransferase [Marinobacter sp. LV10R510-11A]
MTDEYRLRTMTEGDLEQVLEWRNHPEVRRYMYTTHEISLDEHRKWFAGASINPAIDLMIYEKDGEGLGFINFTRTRCPEVADWGFYLTPHAPKGTGRSLGNHALAIAFRTLGLHKVCGQALGFNERSIAFHKAQGFTKEGNLRDQHFDGKEFHDVACFGLLKHEWQTKVEGLNNE